ncbi:S8 family serine peptidase [Umezawaea endophytica]|uniref:S8 family serine peptidase n=1 Tax=Umezawaea endophytica TaxID=1654476 RepID=A0A9X2VLL3_9PSEU|nr:S8 family serine peptidase [Umezawaea endophytica]MCS7478835.1 S8 family serine peptidase [Umezawaea endophytica]
MNNHRTPRSSGVLAASALLVAALLNATGAASAVPDLPLATPVPAVGGGPIVGRVGESLTRATGTVTAFVELTGPPAVEAYTAARSRGEGTDLATTAAKETRRRSDAKADKVLRALRDKDSATREVGKTSNAVPGVVVTADAAELRELASMPEVRAVRLSVPKFVHNASSVQLTNALKVWQQTGRLGDGMRVGVVDTGIDFTHADFGGPGTVAAYDAVDSTTAAPSVFPTAKVVGGKDFSGDDYDARYPEKSTPKPDDNPLDCAGHGTHVAGTAAGYGENADGSTFTGDYSALDADALAKMKIGPGTAPKASLYAVKIFGCEGSTNLTAQALDWTLDPNGDGDFSDHLDVVNLSLGGDYSGQDDPDSLFVRKITAAGVLVVASAGNGGDFYDVGGSPANTPEALAVANTRDAFAVLDGLEVDGATRAGQYSLNFTGYDALDLTAEAVPPADPENLDGCEPFSDADKARVAGKFAWLEWDDDESTRECGSAVRTDNAEAAGAAGAVLSSTRDNFTASIAGNAAIPVFQLTSTATDQVRPALENGSLKVRMTGALRKNVPTTTPKLADTITPTSSRGARGATAAKPDVAAPGDTILSADVGTGTDAASKGGTSMSSPHVAGIAALVRETHPDWSPEEVKAAVVNTAGADVTSGDDNTTGTTEAPMRVGAGRVDARAAVGTEVLAMVEDDPGSVGVSFGPVEVGGPVSLAKTVRVVNKSGRPRTASISYQPVTSVPGVDFDVSTPVVVLQPHGTADFRVTLRVDDPSRLRKSADPTVVKQQADHARQFLAEASGRLVVKPGGNPTALRVPVYAAPKPVADLTTSAAEFTGDRGVLTVDGRGVDQGEGDLAYRSLLSAFELQGTSDELPACDDVRKSDCAANTTAKGGDLRYVGATSTAPLVKAQGGSAEALLAFGVATWANWVTLGSTNTPEISIDTTGDGQADFTTVVAKPKDANGSVKADHWLARTRSADGTVVDEQPVNGQYGDVDTNVMDTDVVVLPVALTALGIDPAGASHRITYTVATDGIYTAPGNEDGVIDQIGTPMSFDPLKPGLWFQGGGDAALTYLAAPGTELVVNRDPAALAADGAGSLLVLQHHNATGRRANLVKVTDRD